MYLCNGYTLRTEPEMKQRFTYLLPGLVLALAALLTNCKKDTSAPPTTSGKPGIAAVLTTPEGKLYAGGEAFFDLTLSSTSDLQYLRAWASVDGSTVPAKLWLDSTFPNGKYLPQFNVRYAIPDSLHDGQKVTIKFSLANKADSNTLSRTITILDANLGVEVKQDKTTAPTGGTVKFTAICGSTVALTHYTIQEEQTNMTWKTLKDSTINSGVESFADDFNYMVPGGLSSGANQLLRFKLTNKKGHTETANVSVKIQ